MTLQDIATKIQARIETAAPGTASRDILTLVGELVDVLQGNGTPVDDKAQMQSKIDHLNALLDNNAKTFLAIKTALGNPNLTQGEIVGEITTKWRHV